MQLIVVCKRLSAKLSNSMIMFVLKFYFFTSCFAGFRKDLHECPQCCFTHFSILSSQKTSILATTIITTFIYTSTYYQWHTEANQCFFSKIEILMLKEMKFSFRNKTSQQVSGVSSLETYFNVHLFFEFLSLLTYPVTIPFSISGRRT